MKLKDLLAKVEYYFIKTALIKLPKDIYEPIIEFIKERITDINSDPSIKEYIEHFIFPINIMPYYNSMTEEHFKKYFIKKYDDDKIPANVYKYKNLKNVAIVVKVFEGIDSPRWERIKGNLPDSWISDDTLVIGRLTFPVKTNLPIKLVDNVIIHELTHFMQTYINLMTNNLDTEVGGLVARKSRTPGASPSGYLPNKEQIPHFQIDIEYYPLLRDAIEADFAKLKSKTPKILYRDAVSTFIGEKSIEEFKSIVNNFKNQNLITESEANNILNLNDSILQSVDFIEWRNNNPKKYKSAIKEFYRNII